MNIIPIEIDVKNLYEHRHLYTDDVEYNSLILSNIFNRSIKLFDKKTYDNLNDDYKIQIVKEANNKEKYKKHDTHIIDKDGTYWLQLILSVTNNPICKQYKWNHYEKYRDSPNVYINIFTFVV